MEGIGFLISLPCVITSSLIDVGLSKMLCGDDSSIEFPFTCGEPSPGYTSRYFPPATHGISSFLSSCSIAAVIPLILGIPYGSLVGVALFVAIWSAVGGVGFFLTSKWANSPKPTTASPKTYRRTALINGKVKTLKPGEFT